MSKASAVSIPKKTRQFYTKKKEIINLPNLVDHQNKSFQWFVEEGLGELLAEISPIDDYTGTKLSLRFKDYHFEEPKLTEAEARENNVSYDAPLKAVIELTNKITGEVKDQEIYLGDYPWMTTRGTFIINGAERVVVSQLIRSAGVFFTADSHGSTNLYGAKLIPGRGAWLEFETAASGALFVKIDRKRKLTVTTLLRALGMSEAAMREGLKHVDNGKTSYLTATLEKDASRGVNESLIEVYRRLRPGDLATVDNARSLVENMFFNYKRFDFSRVGRYKINKRLGLDVANTAENRIMRIEDLIAIIAEVIRLNNTQDLPDDIDSLANRRVKLVGELVQRQFRIGLLRMERNAKDRMSMSDIETVTPSQLINARPVVAAVREFFASSQLSQFMDQINPLSELAHKRRLSSMGPGGLSRERAGFEVRDAHATHYGRICPVETPEGANIGLVLNMAMYARINDYGFLETPYRTVVKGKVTDDVVYLDAADEEHAIIASSSEEVNEKGAFVNTRVSARKHLVAGEVDADEVTHMDAAERQIIGSSAGLIPFVEKNYVYRSLMGSNQQRQAVPLIKPEAPVVGTGLEGEVARNSGQMVLAEEDGVVVSADAQKVVVSYKNRKATYEPLHFVRSNEGTSINQHVVVSTGDNVKAGDSLIEGMSIDNGELALGKNLLVAFMPWNGYNFEDAMVISRKLVEDDTLTSVHIVDYMTEVRETKLGPEIVTSDIPNVSEEALRHLDEDGIVRIGAEVHPGDILVGKITPKGEQELSSEERLLRAIFGEKAKEVRDTSQRMSNGKHGKVVGVKVFSRANGHELKAGVLMQIQVFVAQMRKISVGDKLGGRHGNKGVIARVLPQEDMPFTADGTPVDIVLNPLGVPSRMNVGQLFETHLGMAAKALGINVASPSFNGVPIPKIRELLTKAGLPDDGKQQLYDGHTGEPFKERTTVGCMYMIKLNHMITDKIHARSTGPYTMVTQQPLGGKAQNGGQRFGEMEVWALEAYGASNMLQEMLTIKSDDVYGRSKAYESIIKGTDIIGPKVPESFNVLVKELQGLGLKVDLIEKNKGVILDAEEVLASNIKEEAAHLPEIEVPKEMISDIDVTEDAAVLDEFEVVTLDENDEPVPVGVEASDFETSHKEHDYATDDEDGGSN
ncbi:DNA-directed RNA polymerase subunit beta [bacterium]|nr:DNA-directed RNA polymerase subunit beta [bacterium]NBX98394.1 DNA-directed RNA polymerase subunit beta [bacterium]NDC93702.1 DNA-directed RNA polymerase subunit beta [bacterium]NDD82843.1 DNA-directed RNA polymerase subunit beta [bacterium]NDG28638.1 DNA-directed RNA polymerase subunit beta [bacterium]